MKKLKNIVFSFFLAIVFIFSACNATEKNNNDSFTLQINNGDLKLSVPQTYQIEASVTNLENAKIRYITSSAKIASVNYEGLIAANAEGSATITVTAETPNGMQEKKFKVTVIDERIKISFDTDKISVKQNGTTIADGQYLNSSEPLSVPVNVPQNQTIQKLSVTQGEEEIQTSQISENEFSFTPKTKGAINISVSFVEDNRLATLSGKVIPATFSVNGVSVPLYDDIFISQSTITLTDSNGISSNIELSPEGSFSLQLPKGNYSLRTVYENNVFEKDFTLYANQQYDITAQLSTAYLGGYVTYAGSTHKSYNNADRNATSGQAWSLIDGYRNQAEITNYTYLFQDEAVGLSYYLEGCFDTANSVLGGQLGDSAGGLLISHGPDDLADSGGQKYKVIAGIYEKWLVLTFTGTGWDSYDYRAIANLSELISDAENVKLGVLREGTEYFFFVNDQYVTRYSYPTITTESAFGLANTTTRQTIKNFNYTTDPAKLAQIKSAIPATDLAQQRNIDIYIIAGQSNGTGYSFFDASTLKTTQPDLYYGFDHVYYAGNSRSSDYSVSSLPAIQREIPIMIARLGFGRTSQHFGVEAGAAKVLSSYYNNETGKYAGFIKYAAGGTSLTNSLSGENASEGNWVSPSYENTLSNATEKTGGLYRNLLAQTEKRIAEYKLLGFKVNIKGLFWMQGENDIGQESEYKKAFTFFAQDIRKDLGETSGEDLTEMPIFIGEISETFSSYNNISANRNFIAMQNELASLIDNVYIVKSSVFNINGPSGVLGTDQYHWNSTDMIAIGQLLGEKILSVCIEK